MKDIMSKIFLEILDKERQGIFTNLSHFKNDGYLAGGTALALQIKHRKSADFDVFIQKPVDNYLRLKISKFFGEYKPYVDLSDQISLKTKRNISITFVWYYFQPLFSLVRTSSLSLSSVYDIAADKAHTLGRRAVWRDYVDFFCLFKTKIIDLKRVIELAEKKFGNEFNQGLFLEQLSYFDDLKKSPIQFIEESYSSSEIKSFLEKEVRNYLKMVRLT